MGNKSHHNFHRDFPLCKRCWIPRKMHLLLISSYASLHVFRTQRKVLKLQLLSPLLWDWRGKFFPNKKRETIHSGILLVHLVPTIFLTCCSLSIPLTFCRSFGKLFCLEVHLKWFPIGSCVKLVLLVSPTLWSVRILFNYLKINAKPSS